MDFTEVLTLTVRTRKVEDSRGTSGDTSKRKKFGVELASAPRTRMSMRDVGCAKTVKVVSPLPLVQPGTAEAEGVRAEGGYPPLPNTKLKPRASVCATTSTAGSFTRCRPGREAESRKPMEARPEIINSRLFLEPGEFKVKPDAIHLIGDPNKRTPIYCAIGLTEL
jgi:hypothetical protein